jgi:hypothetical protein
MLMAWSVHAARLSDIQTIVNFCPSSSRPNRATTPTMSAQIPLRIARSPAHPLRHRCLFQRPIAPSTPRCIAATAARAFSSTPARLRDKVRLVDPRMQVAAVEYSMAGRQAPGVRNKGEEPSGMADDIGILQGRRAGSSTAISGRSSSPRLRRYTHGPISRDACKRRALRRTCQSTC